MPKTIRHITTCLLITIIVNGAACTTVVQPLPLPLPIDPLSVTPKLRLACKQTNGIPLDDAYILEQLLAVEDMRLAGFQKPMAVDQSRLACIQRINEPCDGVVCTDDNALPLKVNCQECALAIADQIYGEVFEP